MRPITDIFQSQVAEIIAKQQLFAGVNKLVVAVSGGADSIALLDWLVTETSFGPNLIVAHLNHGLRGTDSDADALFVAEVAQRYGVICCQEIVDVKALASSTGCSLEEAGREARYRFFYKLCDLHSADAVVVAHHADDQAETMLLRLIRGAGTRGLGAMSGRSADGRVLRPFLSVRRAQIETYLRQKGLRWRDDASNQDQMFLRNRVRHELLPLLCSYNPLIATQLCTTADILAADDAALNCVAELKFSQIARLSGQQIRFSLADLQAQPLGIQRRLLRLAISTVAGSCRSVGFDHLQSIAKLMESASSVGAIDLPGSVVVERIYTELVIRNAEVATTLPSIIISGPGTFALGDGRTLVVTIGSGADSTANTDSMVIYFNSVAAPFPWQLRYFRPGDRFSPSGMRSQQKVKEYFINKKIPRGERCRVPILESAGQIIWLCGQRVAAGVGNPDRQGSWIAAALRTSSPTSLPG